MKLELVDRLSEPGSAGRPNDDAFCAGDTLAAVLDGATGLGGRLLDAPSDAAWVARQGADLLLQHAGSRTGRDLLRAVAGDVEARFLAERIRAPAAVYELPMASMMLLQSRGASALEAFWFGDCCALVLRPGQPVEIVGSAFDKRVDEAAAAARLAAQQGVSAAGSLDHPQFLADRRASRNRYNSDEGPWVFSPDARCAEHAETAMVAAPAGTWLLLATDGFLALSTDYGRYPPAGLIEAACAQGLKALLTELRGIEQADPDGVRFPRFKTSDDATALLVRVT